MKNEVHLKSAHQTGRSSHYFSQELCNGPTQMQRWKANICFYSHPSKTIFTNVIRLISPSPTAFNQCIEIVRLCLYEKKTLFSFIIKDIGADFVFLTSKILLLLFWYKCSQINTFTKCGDSSLLLRCHNSIRSPTSHQEAVIFLSYCVVKRLLVIHLILHEMVCARSQLNLRQSLHNYTSSRPFNSYWSSVSSATLNTNLGPVMWKWGRREVTGRYLLAMLDEAANCPWPCKANLHVPILSSLSPLCCLFIPPKPPPPLCNATDAKGQTAQHGHQMTSRHFLKEYLETTFSCTSSFW